MFFEKFEFEVMLFISLVASIGSFMELFEFFLYILLHFVVVNN